jgi:deferrochelatase/peroxidase EfeB
VSRRTLLGSALGIGVGAFADPVLPSARAAVPSLNGEAARRAYGSIGVADGVHQAGIATPRPGNVVIAAFDLVTQSSSAFAGLLSGWTAAIRNLAAGRPSDGDDSGETMGLPPSGLTITVGFGPSLFDDRFGLAARRPAALASLPDLPGERIAASQSGGDIVVQACAEGDIPATHAVRQLRRLAAGVARLRWLASGAAPAPYLLAGGGPRNPLGFIDGTGNPAVGSPAFDATVWLPAGAQPAWLANGTFLCYRRVEIDLVAWDRLTNADQQIVIGRAKASGAPLSGGGPSAPLNLTAHNPDGTPAIPSDSHVRVASPAVNAGATIFRRSFAYEDGVDPVSGRLQAGLLFLAYAADPVTQFVPILRSLAAGDRLNAFTTHTATGIWALPPAAGDGGFIGQALVT